MRQRIIDVLYSMSFGFALTVSAVYFRTLWWKREDYTAGLRLNYICIKTLVLWGIFVYICYRILNKIRIKVKEANIVSAEYDQKNSRRFFWYAFICNLLIWGIWFMLFAPGGGMNDTLNALMTEYRANNQPIVYQILIWYGIKFLNYLSEDMTWAYGGMVVLQMLLCAYVFARVMIWLLNQGIKKTILNVLVMYYSLLPVVADYSITLVKDTLFAVFFVVFIILLYEIVHLDGFLNDNRNFIKTLMVLIGVCCFRNNGTIVCIVSLIVLFLLKHSNKRRVLFLIGMVLFSNMVIGHVEQIRFENDVKYREAVGVPIAQIGAVLNDPNARLDEKDLENLNELLPIKKWKENYRPSFADKVKFDEEFDNDWLNQNKGLFIKTWFNILEKNFPTYVKAYLCHSYGYWGILPYPPDMTQSYFTKINNNTSIDSKWGEYCKAHNLINQSILPKTISNVLDKVCRIVFKANMLFTPGVMIWGVFLCLALLLGEKMYRACVPWLPLVFTWGTMMIASPASLIYRYSYYLVLALPVVFILTVKQYAK